MDIKKAIEKLATKGKISVTNAVNIAKIFAESECEYQREVDADYLRVNIDQDVNLKDIENNMRTIPLIRYSGAKSKALELRNYYDNHSSERKR